MPLRYVIVDMVDIKLDTCITSNEDFVSGLYKILEDLDVIMAESCRSKGATNFKGHDRRLEVQVEYTGACTELIAVECREELVEWMSETVRKGYAVCAQLDVPIMKSRDELNDDEAETRARQTSLAQQHTQQDD